ncbi:uncharacterized protein [Danio rerio]|uniref:Uncharacterized protein n=1 Tax=Danio rerio TaxID=7955 RepID=A0A8M9PFB3_DANRE|nr:uncharacterized protein LOC101885831 isoform X1 [Danio rerio]|eukprot:XP_021325588.1 uncharacterized protein LOC101885831 isoform X1 [Danio rerio]
MCTPAKLRLVFGENDVRKLVLPSGIPSTLQELKSIIQETFSIPECFTLMYEDMEFGGQFFNLDSVDDVQDKCTLKVVQTEPITLNMVAMNRSTLPTESDARSCSSQDTVGLTPVSDTYLSSDSTSSGSQDTVLLSSSETTTSCRSQGWPTKFIVPTFSFDTELLLSDGNKAYQKDGTLLNNHRVTSSVLETLAETIFCYTAYPTGVQIMNVVEMLIEKYPCLKEPGSFNGQYGWQQRIKYKMGNYRAKLRGSQLSCPELEVNQKRKTNENPTPKGFKRPRKAEVNYLPPFPFGETGESLEKERLDLLNEIRKKNNKNIIGEKMEKTFYYRRTEVVKDCPAVKDFMERWPALFCESEIKNEFRRITTISLERTFLEKLDFYTPKLLALFEMKGGVAGIRIRHLLDSLSQQEDRLEDRRDVVIRCLLSFLGESAEELIEDHQDVSRDMIKDTFASHVMKIIVLSRSVEEEDASRSDVIIVIEGTEVLLGCKNLTNACLSLMGCIYSLNLSYPPKLRNTFEVFQKIFLGLDALKFSPKVNSLHRKLLM